MGTLQHPKGGERVFLRAPVLMGGQHVPMHKLRCSEPGCNNEGEIIDRNTASLPNHVVERKFTQKGWFVGKDERHDMCPDCAKKKLLERRARRKGITIINAESLFKPKPEASQEATLPTPPTAIHADAPDELTRDDRRVIFTKLNEVYLSSDKGYETPWTDKKVADDLGVPVAHVAKVRDEMFGPASDNAEIRELLDRAEAMNLRTAEMLAEAKKLHAETNSWMGKANNLNGNIQQLERQHDLLNTQAARIRNAIEP